MRGLKDISSQPPRSLSLSLWPGLCGANEYEKRLVLSANRFYSLRNPGRLLFLGCVCYYMLFHIAGMFSQT